MALMTEEEVRDFIAAHQWTFAKSMPQIPHFYTLRKRARDDAEFATMVQHIRDAGYDVYFGRTKYRYLDVDGMHYWTMGFPVVETILINRAVIKVKAVPVAPAKAVEPPPPPPRAQQLGLI